MTLITKASDLPHSPLQADLRSLYKLANEYSILLIMANFESHIKGAIPVVVEFFAEWNKPEKLMEPVMKEVYEKAGERATVLRVNIDEEPELSKQYGVYTVPSIMIFKEGNVVWQKNGITPAHEIMQQLSLVMA